MKSGNKSQSNLRKQGAFSYLTFCFVAQKTNFQEIVDFALMAHEFDVDQVHFQRISNWSAIKDYHFHAVHVPSHYQHSEFMAMLATLKRLSPLIKPKIVMDFA